MSGFVLFWAAVDTDIICPSRHTMLKQRRTEVVTSDWVDVVQRYVGLVALFRRLPIRHFVECSILTKPLHDEGYATCNLGRVKLGSHRGGRRVPFERFAYYPNITYTCIDIHVHLSTDEHVWSVAFVYSLRVQLKTLFTTYTCTCKR